ncbi:MAG: hypothetical protein U5K99_06085 [Anaerolineales bacterium]|nr:hypothetical protein [Anaerolineales bacterium]
MMHVRIVTPAAPRSRAGNRATATRWANLLRALGHRVTIATSDAGAAAVRRPADAVIALHAWRSAEAIAAAVDHAPHRPLVVALTGTDIYRFQYTDPELTLAGMARAHALIGLHDAVAEDIPARFRARLHTSSTSRPSRCRRATAGPRRSRARSGCCVAGHLRAEKDPLRAAYAVRRAAGGPRASPVRPRSARAHDDSWAEAARTEMAGNPRYRWYGRTRPRARAPADGARARHGRSAR